MVLSIRNIPLFFLVVWLYIAFNEDSVGQFWFGFGNGCWAALVAIPFRDIIFPDVAKKALRIGLLIAYPIVMWFLWSQKSVWYSFPIGYILSFATCLICWDSKWSKRYPGLGSNVSLDNKNSL